MEMYGNFAFLNLRTRCRWLGNFTGLPRGTKWTGGWVGPLDPARGIEPQFLWHLAVVRPFVDWANRYQCILPNSSYSSGEWASISSQSYKGSGIRKISRLVQKLKLGGGGSQAYCFHFDEGKQGQEKTKFEKLLKRHTQKLHLKHKLNYLSSRFRGAQQGYKQSTFRNMLS
jgi:hypothetical protein